MSLVVPAGTLTLTDEFGSVIHATPGLGACGSSLRFSMRSCAPPPETLKASATPADAPSARITAATATMGPGRRLRFLMYMRHDLSCSIRFTGCSGEARV
jgi:hypothetical protein